MGRVNFIFAIILFALTSKISIANDAVPADKTHLDKYLLHCIKSEASAWDKINQIVKFENISIIDAILENNFPFVFGINIPRHFVMNEESCYVVLSRYWEKSCRIDTFTLYNEEYISLSDIESISCFNRNAKLKYLYLEEIIKDKTYILSDIDIDKIKDGTFPRQSEFALTEKDIKDIVSFCKKHAPKKTEYTTWKINGTTKMGKALYIASKVFFAGTTVVHDESTPSTPLYLSLHFSNNIQLTYKYDIEKEDLVGCYYIYKGKKVFNTDSDVKNNADNGFFQNIRKWFQ